MRILVVDNDSTYLGLLSEVLLLHGYVVVTARDGEEAVETLRSATVDFVISDISMPRMNGLNLHKWVRQNPRTRDIPFAWNSIYRELRNAVEVGDPSIDLVFEKSMPVPDLITRVGQLASARSQE